MQMGKQTRRIKSDRKEQVAACLLLAGSTVVVLVLSLVC